MKNIIVVVLIFLQTLLSCSVFQHQQQQNTSNFPLQKIQVIPSQRQLNWQKLEYYGFIHFNMNTFTDREWGYGDENPSWFNPTDLDAEQWVKVAKKAGMKGLILTAKHHDGFCLWPSNYTEHDVSNSPYKNGKGDIVKELSEACKKHGLLFGVYLSPWDRNHAEYGREKYVEDFKGQLKELLTNYGDLFEVWFDGANGGDGYYGGASEQRKIDADSYYQWREVINMVRKYQPNAVIFGAKGADIRWIGNELGTGAETNWSMMDVKASDHVSREILQEGDSNGNVWKPAEADVSVRPGWYYHPREDHMVRPLSQMVDIYYKSVGRNANLLLNIPVDVRGLVHENDENRLYELKNVIEADFKNKITSTASYSINNKKIAKKIANNVLSDYKLDSYVILKTKEANAIYIDFKSPKIFNRLQLQENIAHGQNVYSFKFEVYKDDKWVEVVRGTTIGYQRLLRFQPVRASKARLIIEKSKSNPVISTLNLYKAPNLLVEPVVERNKQGEVSFKVADKQTEVYYSFKNEDISNFMKFKSPLQISEPTEIFYASYDPETKKYSSVQRMKLDVPKAKWSVIDSSGEKIEDGEKAIDENSTSVYASTEEKPEIIIDLGEIMNLAGFKYLPSQERWAFGTIKNYEFYTSNDLENWDIVKTGEFNNIKNNPIEQIELFNTIKTRYIKLKSITTTDGSKQCTFAEIGIITEKN